MNAQRAREAAGRQIEVLFIEERGALTVDLADGTDADAVAMAVVDCLGASSFEDAEGRLQDGLEGHGVTVRRAP